MSTVNPIDLLFGGMEKLGPGSDAHTRLALSLLPARKFRLVVDAGCGAGRQTRALAKELDTLVHAVDLHQPFLDELLRRAQEEGIGHLVQAHCMDMKDIPAVFQGIDLLWPEGAAYSIGFADALAAWIPVISPGGFAAVSELSWLREKIPDAVKEFFQSGYPGMQSIPRNIAAAEGAGYRLIDTFTLPAATWVEGYYEILEPRANALAAHPDASVREWAVETLREIEIFNCSEDSYGYVFYLLQCA